jgi:hypothetical protein
LSVGHSPDLGQSLITRKVVRPGAGRPLRGVCQFLGHLFGPMGLVLVWFSSRIPFVRVGGVSSAMAYLRGRVMVLVELPVD